MVLSKGACKKIAKSIDFEVLSLSCGGGGKL